MAKNPTLALNTLERLKLRVKHGVMANNDTLEILRRYPPEPKPRWTGPLKELDLDRTRFANVYRQAMNPIVPIEARERDPAEWFAQRQWEKVRSGLSEKEAAARVADELVEERQRAIEQALEMARSEFAPNDMDGYSSYRAKLEKPWKEWSESERAELDGWLMTSVLGWSWRLERMCDEEAVLEDPGDLAKALFRLREKVFGVKDDERSFEFGGEDEPEVDDALFMKLQALAETTPWSQWSDAEKKDMDTFLGTVGDTFFISDPELGDTIGPGLSPEQLRLEIFPELCATYERPDMPKEDGPKLKEDGRVVNVKYAEQPEAMGKMLARHGLFPEMDVDKLIAEALDAPDDDEDHIPKELAQALQTARRPDSHAMRRVQAAKQSAQEARFLERIYSRPPLKQEDD